MHYIQKILSQIKMVLKFVWRHAFTLTLAYLFLEVILESGIPVLLNTTIMFCTTIFIDWLKMKFKGSGPVSDDFYHKMRINNSFSTIDYDSDRHRVGTSAYCRNMSSNW